MRRVLVYIRGNTRGDGHADKVAGGAKFRI